MKAEDLAWNSSEAAGLIADVNAKGTTPASKPIRANAHTGGNSTKLQAALEQRYADVRELFQVGMEVDPQHGPLYHAYGNFELVRYLRF